MWFYSSDSHKKKKKKRKIVYVCLGRGLNYSNDNFWMGRN